MKKYLLIYFAFWLHSVAAQSAMELNNEALALDSVGKHQSAIEKYNQALQLAPDEAIIWYNRGIVRMKLNQHSLACVDFNKAIVLDTGLVDAYFNRYLANRAGGNYQFAMADLNHYLQFHNNETSALEQRISLAMEMKDYKIAQKDLELLVQLFPDYVDYALELADVCILTKDYSRAEQLLSNLIQVRYDDPFLYLSRAYVLHYKGNYEQSLNDINLFALHQEGNREADKLKGDNLFFLKRFEDAADIFERLLRSDSTNADLLADYGHCLLQQAKYAEAEQILSRSIRAKNNSPAYAYLGRGIARFNLGMYDKACEDWDKSNRLGEGRALEYLNENCKKENSTKTR